MQLPPQAVQTIRGFLDLPDDAQDRFLEAIENADFNFNTYELARDVARRAPVPTSLAAGFIQVLTQLYAAKDTYQSPLDKFLDEEIAPGLKTQIVSQLENSSKEEAEARWVRLRSFLAAALKFDKTVGIAAKVGPIMTDHEHIFVDARVFSDVRFVFHPDVSEKPDAAAIVHMLRITTRDIFGNSKAEHFALDSNDIRLMKQLMDRAIKKEDTIVKSMEPGGVKILTPKGVF